MFVIKTKKNIRYVLNNYGRNVKAYRKKFETELDAKLSEQLKFASV